MLKRKAFKDAEYIVTSVETGPFRCIVNGKEVEENVVTNFHIIHRGNDVSVGSGLSLEQRRYFKEHPEELVGKTVTIQYFEETENTKGEFSLRFPTLKYIYENGRDV
jgi:DNA ligase-1